MIIPVDNIWSELFDRSPGIYGWKYCIPKMDPGANTLVEDN